MKRVFKASEVDKALEEQMGPFDYAVHALRRALWSAAGFSLVLNLLQLTIPLYMMQVLDRVSSSGNLNTLYLLTLIAAIALSVSLTLDVVRSFILNRAASWLETRLGVNLFPIVALARHRGQGQDAGALEDLWRLRSFMSSPAILAIFDAPWMIFYLIILYMLAIPIGVIATIGAVVLVIIAIQGEAAVRSKLEPTHANVTRTREYLLGIQSGADEIIAMGMLDTIKARWLKMNVRALEGQYLSSGHASLNLSLFKHARLLLQLVVLFTGAFLAVAGEVSLGVVIGASIIMSRALGPVEQSISSWKQALSSWSAYQSLKRILKEPQKEQRSVRRPTEAKSLKIQGLSYTLPRHETPFLVDIEFTVEPGSMMALVGPSGSGKSVLTRLLVGNQKPDCGHIHIGDYELSNFSQEELGPYIGYVAQHPTFIKGTIEENIARFQDYDREAVVDAARRIGAHQFITELKDGYHTEIGGFDGHHLSGGQAQRLAIARALCGNPGMLIFDEPNLNLDIDAENMLFQIIREEKKRGTTIVTVTHQPTMVNLADWVCLIRSGRVAKVGSRDEVMTWLRGPRRRSSDQSRFQAVPE